MSLRILAIDDERAFLEMLHKACQLMGHTMVAAESLEEGLRRALDEDFDIVLLDNHFPEGHADSIVPSLQSAKPQLPIVITTGNESDQHARNCIRLGAKEFLGKPFGLDELADVMRRHCQSFSDQASRVA